MLTVNEKEAIIHFSKNVRHKNVNMLISVSSLYNLKVWKQNVNQAYIYNHRTCK